LTGYSPSTVAEIPIPVPLYQKQNPYGLAAVRTQVVAVRGRREKHWSYGTAL
jgi:hypothetical protein